MAEPTPSPAPGHPAAPVVEFAEWLPALGGSRLLRVHGEASSSAAPTLVLRAPAGEHRIEPRAASRFTRAHEWRASYLIPAELVTAGWTDTTLEWPDATRLRIPDPPAAPRAEVIDPSVLAALRARRTATTPPPDTTPPSPTTADSAPSSPLAPAPPERTAAAAPDGVPPSPGAATSVSPGVAASARSWTDPPEAASGSVFDVEAVWTAKRAELERELSRAAEAIARAREGERAAREAVLAALANVRADLRAARAARAAGESTIAALTAELEAERIAHAVTRRTAADLRTALAQARRHGDVRDAAIARGEAEGLRTALQAERSARANAEDALRETRREGSALMERIAELNRAAESDDEAHARRAREHAGTAAAAARRPKQETGELLANLEAAAATLRASRAPGETTWGATPVDSAAPNGTPAGTPAHAAASDGTPAATLADPAALDGRPAGTPAHAAALDGTPAATLADPAAANGTPAATTLRSPRLPAATPPGHADAVGTRVSVGGAGQARPLRRVLVALAERDPVAAGEILAGLLRAQGPLFDEPVAYDLTVAGIGTFAVTVTNGVAAVERVSRPRSRRAARFELRSDPLTLAELLAGEERRIGRFAGRARVSRRRRTARDVLKALPAAEMSLAAAVRAGARLEPAHVYRALPLAIDPAWTAGHAFTVAQEIVDPDPRTWYLAVRDGAGVEVSESAPEQTVDATVTMTSAAFDRLLRDEPPPPGERPLVRGDRAAVALLKEWTDRARGAA